MYLLKYDLNSFLSHNYICEISTVANDSKQLNSKQSAALDSYNKSIFLFGDENHNLGMPKTQMLEILNKGLLFLPAHTPWIITLLIKYLTKFV